MNRIWIGKTRCCGAIVAAEAQLPDTSQDSLAQVVGEWALRGLLIEMVEAETVTIDGVCRCEKA